MARRIGRIVLFVAAAVLLVLPPLLIAHPIAYIPLTSAVLIVIVSWLYLQLVRRKLEISVESMVKDCERGAKTSLVVSLFNRAPVPLSRVTLDFYVTDLFGAYDEVKQLACSLKAREQVNLGFDVQFAHLGTYYAGIKDVVVHDLLGLFSATIEGSDRRQVTVRPRKMNMAEAVQMTAVPDESRKALKPVSADDVDYATVREYRYGDQLKTIHWNLTARSPQGTMYTRLYEAYVNPSLTIVIDPCAPDGRSDEDMMSLFDGMVELSAALSAQARFEGVDADVRYVTRDGEAAATRLSNEADANTMVADMMRITRVEDASSDVAGMAEDLVRQAGGRSHGSGNVALVTSRVDSEHLSTLVEVAMNRRNVLAFLAVPRDLVGRDREKFAAPMRRLNSVGASWWMVESNPVKTEVVGL